MTKPQQSRLLHFAALVVTLAAAGVTAWALHSPSPLVVAAAAVLVRLDVVLKKADAPLFPPDAPTKGVVTPTSEAITKQD